jgi:hypothetical protein
VLPLRASFKASCFSDGNSISLIEKFCPAASSAGRRKLGVDIDKAPAHNSRVTQNFFGHNPLKRLPNSLYPRDFSPSAFYLFGEVKNALIWQEIPDRIDLLEPLLRF